MHAAEQIQIGQKPTLEVDVAVVDGGLAGLTAAGTAARVGATIAVVDARSVGGRARRVERNGFTLNEGAHALYRGAGGRAVLESLGLRPTGVNPPAETYRVAWDGEIARLPTDARSIVSTRLLGVRSKVKRAGWFGDVARVAAGDASLDDWLDHERAQPERRQAPVDLPRTGKPDALPPNVGGSSNGRSLTATGARRVDSGRGVGQGVITRSGDRAGSLRPSTIPRGN